MGHIEGNVRIKAPVEDVFGFVSDWRNVERFYAGVYDYDCLSERVCGDGARFRYKIKPPLIGETAYTLEMTDFALNRGWTMASIEGPDLVERWWFDAEPGSPSYTCIRYALHYKVPVPVVGGVIDALFVKPQWEARVETTLKNIRLMVESKQTG